MTRRRTPRPKALWTTLPRARVIVAISRKRRIRPATAARAASQRRYRQRVKDWLRAGTPAHRVCVVSLRLQWSPVAATQVHHKYGRRGRLLNWEPGWLPVSACGHQWITDYPKEAVALGLVGPVGTWNDFARAAAHVQTV